MDSILFSTMSDPARPRILYLTHRVPYPPDKGDRIRNYHILTWLARRATVDLACLDDEGLDESRGRALSSLADRVEVIRQGRGARWARSVWSLGRGRTASEGAFRSPELGSVLRRWTKETRYEAVLVSASSLAPYLHLPDLAGVPAVVDFVDVDSQKWLDYARAVRGPRAWLYRLEGERLGRLEREATEWASGVLLVSEAETELFRRSCDAPNVFTIPNGVDLDYFRPADEPAGAGRTCVFVGALDYLPNVDGACWFCREAWPEIHQRRPGSRLLLVGRRPVPAVLRLGAVPGVEVVGQVPDVRPHMVGAGVVVVPLRLARGVQNKVLEAMAMGRATVASPQSLAGLGTRDDVPAHSATSPAEWVQSVVRLMDDPDLRRRLSEDGRRYVEKHRRWDHCLEPLGAILGFGDEVGRPAMEPATHRLDG